MTAPPGWIPDFSMLLLTHNRPQMLREVLTFYASQSPRFKIVIHDSSTADVQAQNAAVIERFAPEMEYVPYPSETHPREKVRAAAREAQTEFAVFAPDDDVFVLSGILAALDFLRANHDYVACHGRYYGARRNNRKKVKFVLDQSSIPHESPNPCARIAAQLCNYQSTWYSVQRQKVLASATDVPDGLASGHFIELAQACALLVEGKVGVVSLPYLVRDHLQEADPRYIGHPIGMLLHDSEAFAAEYAVFRDALARRLCAHDAARDWAHQIDLLYALYVHLNFNASTVIQDFGRSGVLTRPERANLYAMIRAKHKGRVPARLLARLLDPLLRAGWPGYGRLS